MSGKARILLVDDERDITAVFKKGLELNGYAVDAFNDPFKASDSFMPGYYQVAVLDIRMPGMNGIELARSIMSRDPKLKVCLITAFENYEGQASVYFKNNKNCSFLKKPLTLALLHGHIEKRVLNV